MSDKLNKKPESQQKPKSAWAKLDSIERFKLVLQATGVIALLFSAVGLWLNFESRQEDRVNRAWGLVASKTGLRTALQYLNSRHEDLAGLDLKGAQLPGINLRAANLTGTDLSEANLEDADLSSANLERAKLVGADLSNAKLNKANLLNADFKKAFMEVAHLEEANLQHADFTEAHMLDVDLRGAILFGADFSQVGNLTENQILERSNLQWAKMPDGKVVENGDFKIEGSRVIK